MADEPVYAEVKSVVCFGDEIWPPGPLEDFSPANAEHFGFTAQVFIGTPDEDPADSFDMVVCTPTWFAQHHSTGSWPQEPRLPGMPPSVLPGAAFWFMPRWDRGAFRAAIDSVCQVYSPAPDWQILADRIARLIPWEYDYAFDRKVNMAAGISSDAQPGVEGDGRG